MNTSAFLQQVFFSGHYLIRTDVAIVGVACALGLRIFIPRTIRNSWPNSQNTSPTKDTPVSFFWNEKIFSMTNKTEAFYCRNYRKKTFSYLKRKVKYSSFRNWIKAVLNQGWTGFILYCQPLPSQAELRTCQAKQTWPSAAVWAEFLRSTLQKLSLS